MAALLGLDVMGLSAAIIAGVLGAAEIELPADAMAARSGPDLSTIDGTLDALYASISGPKGEPRDWATFDAVFIESATMAAFDAGPDGRARFVEMTPADYKQKSGPVLVEAGFTEKETHRILEVFGGMAHAWSTYHGTYTLPGEDAPREIRGINSIQLVKISDEWRIRSIQWEATSTAGQIPAKYAGE